MRFAYIEAVNSRPACACVLSAYYWLGASRKLVRFDQAPEELKELHEALWDIENINDADWKPTDTLADYLKSK